MVDVTTTTKFWVDFEMSETTAKHGGWVRLACFNTHHALNMANIVWGGFSHSTTKETKYLINNARNEVRDDLMPGVDLSGHRTVKTAIDKNGAWGCENQWTAAFLSKMAPQ
jgi:hypothetical protein